MKLKDLFEVASAGVTSVASIGQVEFAGSPSQIKLYKRCNQTNSSKCIARIRRRKGEGWRFQTTKEWDEMKLPHIGYLKSMKTPVNGNKTISNNLESMLSSWGVKYDKLMKREK